MVSVFFDIETTGLSPLDSRVTCVGFFHEEFGVRVFSALDEVSLLRDATNCLYDWIGVSLVSFNGDSFDIPFLLKRLELLGCSSFDAGVGKSKYYIDDSGVERCDGSVPGMVSCFDFWSSFLKSVSHVDLLPIISRKYVEFGGRTGTGRISKDTARSFLDVYEPRGPNAVHGLMVAKTSSDWSDIFLHNSLDLFTTKRLFDVSCDKGWL